MTTVTERQYAFWDSGVGAQEADDVDVRPLECSVTVGVCRINTGAMGKEVPDDVDASQPSARCDRWCQQHSHPLPAPESLEAFYTSYVRYLDSTHVLNPRYNPFAREL
ncbi:UNVERIFIED_CONTAM: hypothetical protein HDU68_008551 [Siphonaria sp. JEL0065]|nr:hypothetical protein HDU68_008551 [Siphonaria sp. JEL0065]